MRSLLNKNIHWLGMILVLALVGCGEQIQLDQPWYYDAKKASSESDEACNTADPNSDVIQPPIPVDAISDLVPIRGDTLFARKPNGRMVLTTDGGDTWQSIPFSKDSTSLKCYIKELTIDNNGILWALTTGTKSRRQSSFQVAIGCSADLGKTWAWQQFDWRTLSFYKIYSQRKKPLKLATFDGRVYELGDKVGKQWTFVEHVPEIDQKYKSTHWPANDSWLTDNFNNGHYKFLRTGELQIKEADTWKHITNISFVNNVDDVCRCDSSLYLIAYNAYNGKKPLSYLVRITRGQVRDVISTEAGLQELRCDDKQRLWVFGYEGLYSLEQRTVLLKH